MCSTVAWYTLILNIVLQRKCLEYFVVWKMADVTGKLACPHIQLIHIQLINSDNPCILWTELSGLHLGLKV